MKKELRHRAKIDTDKTVIKTDLAILLFEENGLCYCYCPLLDLYGYGNTEEEAHASYEVNLREFFKYAENKKTLEKELKRLGWKIKSKSKKSSEKYIAPEFADLIAHNEELNRIMTDIPNFRKFSEPFRIQTFA